MPDTLQHGDCTIAFEQHASSREDLRGDERTVVLLHGFGMSRVALRPLAASLLDRGAAARTLLADARGHGETRCPDRDDAHGYPMMRDDLEALIATEAPRGAHLVGHSMGGQVALMLGIARPDLVRSLTLIGAGPCRTVTDPKEERIWQRAAGAFEAASPQELHASLASAAPTDHEDLRAERLYADARGADLARVIRGGFLEIESNDDACASVSAPALVIVGAADRTWLDPSRQLAARIPRSTLRIVDAAGHLVHLEHADACASWISDFIAEHA